ncbi:hypothetical protein BB560_002131 [Smittium megazygosporum]|uniref:Aminopeptidase n=1 Tax=Smittium megazygosporum TaxID=133381 RepID=A0A2T9ZFK6_9FUNG|nr:hypothetical protein BB560_002131 [Smittium megazygosporum]
MKRRVTPSQERLDRQAMLPIEEQEYQESSHENHLLPLDPPLKPRKSYFFRILIALFVCLALITLFFTSSNQRKPAFKKKMVQKKSDEDRVLLPINVRPDRYELSLTPDLDKLVYTGEVSIELSILNKTDTIVLHANEVSVTSGSLKIGGKSYGIDKSKITPDPEEETISIDLPITLSPNTKHVVLALKFNGVLNNLMAGFYRSQYTDAKGNQKYMATTQFEPTDARRAFPCWDEPALKSVFSVTLNVDKGLTALSNMDVKKSVPIGNTGKVAVTFEDTPIMSTYLLAFVVGELEYIEAYTSGKSNKEKVRCRVYTPPGLKNMGQFALDATTKILEFYAKSFEIPYPLAKLDQIAIPDFEAGAMENWGLITYRTVALLVDEQNSSSRAKQQVAATVAHELAHQWFGNLVTMEWWSELWLNEGFATWVGNLAVDFIFPEWETWTQFLVDEYSRALALDSMRSSHPIQVPVRRSSEISQIFDNISYSKGASTIRMLSSYLTLEKFMKGINIYLKRHKYKNASTDDLWAALSEASGKDVGKFMTLWTKNIGYPLLSVTESKDGKSIDIVQNRFLSSGTASPEEDSVIWWVPLLMSTSTSPKVSSNDILSDRQSTLTFPKNFSLSGDSWFKINSGTVSISRVKYSTNANKRLAAAVERGELALNDRIGLVADAGALSFSGHIPTSDYLTLLKSFKVETNLVVWQEISGRLDTLTSTWAEEPQQVLESLYKLQVELFTPVMEKLGWDPKADESTLDSRLRSLAIKSLGFANDESVIKEAKARFYRYLEGDQSALQVDIRAAVFAITVYNGGETEYEMAKKHYMDDSLPMDQRLMALTSLGSTDNTELIKKTLEFVLTDDVRNQDIYNGLILLSVHPNGKEMLWKWYMDSYDKLVELFRASMASLGTMIKICAGEFASVKKAEEVKAFLADKDTSKFGMALDQTLEKIQSRAAWLERDRNDVREWLAANYK